MRTYRILSLIVVVACFALVGVLYGRLPDPFPVHWNADGVADRFRAKPLAPFITPLIAAATLLLMFVLPKLSPRRFGVGSFRKVFDLCFFASIVYSGWMCGVHLLQVLHFPIPLANVSQVSTGVLLAVIGNFLGKTRKNFWLGIRTPWTLSSDEVWLRTHRLAGVLFVASGLFCVLLGAVGGSAGLGIASVLGACGVAVVFSYICYRRLHEQGDRQQQRNTP